VHGHVNPLSSCGQIHQKKSWRMKKIGAECFRHLQDWVWGSHEDMGVFVCVSPLPGGFQWLALDSASNQGFWRLDWFLNEHGDKVVQL
jgi:hypothetical protein